MTPTRKNETYRRRVLHLQARIKETVSWLENAKEILEGCGIAALQDLADDCGRLTEDLIEDTLPQCEICRSTKFAELHTVMVKNTGREILPNSTVYQCCTCGKKYHKQDGEKIGLVYDE